MFLIALAILSAHGVCMCMCACACAYAACQLFVAYF